MREVLLAGLCAAFITAPICAARGEPTGADGQQLRPGNVGPGSEKNSQVSPTSPEIPTHAQPPPDINLPDDADSSSSSTREPQNRPDSGSQPPANAR